MRTRNIREVMMRGICGLGLAMILAGCASLMSHTPQTHVLYSGATRPVSEVAVVLMDPGAFLVKMDNQPLRIKDQGEGDRFQLLPGKHVFTVKNLRAEKYLETGPLGKLMSEFNKDKDVTVDAEAGATYRVVLEQAGVKANDVALGSMWFVRIKRESSR
jgi:hypothetical protein